MSCTDTAAYVLGALPAPERPAFEEHLRECDDCERTVAELAGLPGLLSRVDPNDLADPPPPPDTLLPRLLRGVRRERRSRRLALSGLAASVALVVGLGAGALVHQLDTPQSGVAMSQLSASPLHATAAVSPAAGGTRIVLHCTYTASGYPGENAYVLVVTDRSGGTHRLATWEVGPDHLADVTASVSLAPADIASVEVRTTAGAPLLRLQPT
jgi:anti-sigma factor RsiW